VTIRRTLPDSTVREDGGLLVVEGDLWGGDQDVVTLQNVLSARPKCRDLVPMSCPCAEQQYLPRGSTNTLLCTASASRHRLCETTRAP